MNLEPIQQKNSHLRSEDLTIRLSDQPMNKQSIDYSGINNNICSVIPQVRSWEVERLFPVDPRLKEKHIKSDIKESMTKHSEKKE